MHNPWKTLKTTIPYENPWVRIDHNEVLNPAGKPGIYGVVHFKNHAIGIVPVDKEGYTWLVGQFRYALDSYEWEIPEGGCPVGTEPLATAKRELKEETGLVAQEWTQIMEFHLSNSVTDEYGIAYLAKGLSQETAEPEETEDLTLRRLPLTEAIQMTMDGRIKDALSILALQRVALLNDKV